MLSIMRIRIWYARPCIILLRWHLPCGRGGRGGGEKEVSGACICSLKISCIGFTLSDWLKLLARTAILQTNFTPVHLSAYLVPHRHFLSFDTVSPLARRRCPASQHKHHQASMQEILRLECLMGSHRGCLLWLGGIWFKCLLPTIRLQKAGTSTLTYQVR